MKVFFHLLKIYVSSVFNFKNLRMQIQKRKTKNGETVTKNSTLKIIGFAILFLVVIAEVLLLFGFYVISLYGSAKAANNMKLLFELATVTVSLVTFVFGFLVTASTYYIGEIEELFLSMPINPRTLFATKFTATYINGLITSAIFFGLVMAIYGIFERPNVMFYFWGTLCAMLIPLPTIAVAYFVNVLLMRFTRIFKNKNLITAIGAAIGIFLSFGFNYLIQSSTKQGVDFAAMTESIASQTALFETFGSFYPPVKLVGALLVNPMSLKAIVNFILLAAISMVLPAAVIFFMSKLYVSSLVGFGEKKVKRLAAKDVSTYISKNIKSTTPLFSYAKREFVMMNRTPIYLLNGPFMIILLPIALLIPAFAKGLSLESIPPAALYFMNTSAGVVAVGLAAGVLGSMTNIADTALSRDAKFIPVLKSLPIDVKLFMYAKLIHAMIFAVVAIVMCVGIAAFVFKFTVLHIIFASLVALVFSALLNLVGLFLDTAKPKLLWDNPIAAMKQNMNVAFIMLFNFIIMGLAGLALFFARNSYTWLLLIYFVFIPGAIFAVLLKPYGIYAERKIHNIEL